MGVVVSQVSSGFSVTVSMRCRRCHRNYNHGCPDVDWFLDEPDTRRDKSLVFSVSVIDGEQGALKRLERALLTRRGKVMSRRNCPFTVAHARVGSVVRGRLRVGH
jgi:hypothetical protein